MTTLDSYHDGRNALLSSITEKISKDEHFLAGWLTGGQGKNQADSVSDIDLTVVVREQDSVTLCMRNAPTSAGTSPERQAIFSQSGKPALIHENNNNAPEGGTFTFVLYAESALMVDWTLLPQAVAVRPFRSQLVFEKVDIPVSSPPQPEELTQSKELVAETWAIFWMMTAITVKYIIRGDGVFAAQWIENLTGMVNKIERLVDREPWIYVRGSRSRLQPGSEKQLESIRELCSRMQELRSRVNEFTGSESSMPLAEIETLFTIATK
jgi:hypothetical protein